MEEIIRRLRLIDDAAWGRYAFTHDILGGKVPLSQQDEMTRKAVACGVEWARRMIEQTGAHDPDSMLEAFGLEVRENGADMTSAPRPLYAQFVPDRGIQIMSQPIELYSALYEGEADKSYLPSPSQVRATLLSHELFHYVEESNKDEIYTLTEKIQLWKLLFIKWDSTIRAVSEIAAMSFAKTLSQADYSPFILDILLLFGYNKKNAEHIFQSILEISNNSDRQRN